MTSLAKSQTPVAPAQALRTPITPSTTRPGVKLRANLKSISHRCYLFEVALVWELTKETIVLPRGCLQGGSGVKQLLDRSVKQFRGGLESEAHRLSHHSTLGSREINKKNAPRRPPGGRNCGARRKSRRRDVLLACFLFLAQEEAAPNQQQEPRQNLGSGAEYNHERGRQKANLP